MLEDGTDYFIDAPKGDDYNFPKVYNSEKDGDFEAWMLEQGYPRYLLYGYREFVRAWKKCEN